MIKAIVAGAAGRMGGRIIHMLHQNADVTLAAAFEHPGSPSVNMDVGQVVGLGETGLKVAASLKEVINQGDVVIDFTAPQATREHLQLATVHARIGIAQLDIRHEGPP